MCVTIIMKKCRNKIVRRPIMYVIKRIEIQYFRSIYKVTINNIADLNMFSGKNDVGKSNVLKALNLFFNNRIDAETEFVFSDNFNLFRLEEVRRDSVKGKQFIRIKITFDRGESFEKTLPKVFSVTKKWYRNDFYPSEVKDDIEDRMSSEGKVYNESRSKMSLTKFLNRIRYFYIPAIKDRNIFNDMLLCLRETLYNSKLAKDKDLETVLKETSDKVAGAAASLNTEFYNVSKIDSAIVPPDNVSELYRTLKIMTTTKNGNVNIWDRGDGIKVRYIPSILNYIAQNTSNICIWGYEEPENSLEYNLALRMADDFEVYANKSQILITTHSAAFISLNNEKKIRLFRCYKKDECTKILEMQQASQSEDLKEELGYMHLMTEQNKEYKRQMLELEGLKHESELLKISLEQFTKPILMTEGKTDVDILLTAWDKLYDYECPFVIKSCNVYPENEEASAAGCKMLANTLTSWKYDASNQIIGLFDNDTEGKKAYGLDANFFTYQSNVKVHNNGKAYAILLPAVNGLDKFEQASNLCIEFYFDKECLQKRIDGRGLELEAQRIIEKAGDCIISQKDPDIDTQLFLYKPKKNSKSYFAEKIVPSLEKEKFENFRNLFELVLAILGDSKSENLALEECAVTENII